MPLPCPKCPQYNRGYVKALAQDHSFCRGSRRNRVMPAIPGPPRATAGDGTPPVDRAPGLIRTISARDAATVTGQMTVTVVGAAGKLSDDGSVPMESQTKKIAFPEEITRVAHLLFADNDGNLCDTACACAETTDDTPISRDRHTFPRSLIFGIGFAPTGWVSTAVAMFFPRSPTTPQAVAGDPSTGVGGLFSRRSQWSLITAGFLMWMPISISFDNRKKHGNCVQPWPGSGATAPPSPRIRTVPASASGSWRPGYGLQQLRLLHGAESTGCPPARHAAGHRIPGQRQRLDDQRVLLGRILVGPAAAPGRPVTRGLRIPCRKNACTGGACSRW